MICVSFRSDQTLHLDINDKNNLTKSRNIQEKEDDMRSCVSDESKYTFYSVSKCFIKNILQHTYLLSFRHIIQHLLLVLCVVLYQIQKMVQIKFKHL